MKIKTGDRVKFLNDTGAGEVTRIIDQKTALVQIDGGFEVPWLIRDLVVEAGSYHMEDDDEMEEQSIKESKQAFTENIVLNDEEEVLADEEVVFAFVPDPSSSEFDTFLINSSSYHIKYTIARKQEGEMILFHEGNLEPGIKVELGTYLPGNLNEEEYFRIQALFFNHSFYVNLPPADVLIKVAASEMYDAANCEENDYFHEKAIIHKIHDWKNAGRKTSEMEIDTEALKKAMFTKGDIKAPKIEKPEKVIEEVDLHIEQLVDQYKGMENSEILDIQLAKFRTSLESAIIHKKRKIVFIHGIGNGKLKHEIRRTLDHEYKNVKYQDASFKEYGYGATMVIIG